MHDEAPALIQDQDMIDRLDKISILLNKFRRMGDPFNNFFYGVFLSFMLALLDPVAGGIALCLIVVYWTYQRWGVMQLTQALHCYRQIIHPRGVSHLEHPQWYLSVLWPLFSRQYIRAAEQEIQTLKEILKISHVTKDSL